MALQMDDPFAVHRREFCLLNRFEPSVPGTEIGEVVAARAQMNVDKFVPAGAIGAVPLGFGHGDTYAGQESRCRATAGGRPFPRRRWSAERKCRLNADLRGSMRLASPSAPPSASPKTRIRCSVPPGCPGTN